MNKDVLIIVESVYNDQTIRLAKSMANTLKCKILGVDEASTVNIESYKVIGYGSGIYFGKHHTKLIEFARNLSDHKQDAFVFCTHGNPFVGNYQKSLCTILKKKKRNIIGMFDTVGFDGTGPFMLVNGAHKGRPNEKDCRKATKFISKIMSEYIQVDLYMNQVRPNKIIEGIPNTYQIDGKTLVGDKVTINHGQCNGCGICTAKCPLNIFDIKNNKSVPIRELDCIYCGICQQFCKQGAIFLHGTKRDYIRVAIHHRNKNGL